MIRQCTDVDFESIWEIINEGAQAYKGVIPEDQWTKPYMSKEKLHEEIRDGVQFSGYSPDPGAESSLVAVMGAQTVEDVTLIRHAYVRSGYQKRGIGGELLSQLMKQSTNPVLVGTWTHAVWAIHFYEKHGFTLVDAKVKDRLLNRYWNVPERQIETSVVLADQKWMSKLE